MKINLVECESVPAKLPEAVAKEVDAMCKGLPTGCDYFRKSYTPADTHFEPGERSEVSIVTTSSVDKTNEVVLAENVQLDQFRKSNVVLYNHDPHAIIGESAWIKYQKSDESIRAKTKYFQNTEGVESKWYQFVDETWTMVKAGALKGKSIGFQPLKPLREATSEELAIHPEWKGAGVWESCLLLEYSVCPIGMNNDALVEAVNTKSLDAVKLKAMGIELPVAEAVVEAVAEVVVEIVKAEPQKDVLDPEVLKAAIAYVRNKCKPKAKKKPVDVDALLAKAIDQMAQSLDLGVIVAEAVRIHRHRGRA